MVKGISRRVVMVKSPDPEIFDEAIFIVRDGAFHRSGVTGEELLSEALSVAETYVRGAGGSKKRLSLPPWSWALLGGAAVGIAWLLSVIL